MKIVIESPKKPTDSDLEEIFKCGIEEKTDCNSHSDSYLITYAYSYCALRQVTNINNEF